MPVNGNSMAEKYNEVIAFILIGSIFIVFLATIIILVVIKFNNRQAKNKQEKQVMKSQFEQELLRTQIEIQEQTLKTISEEIHDNVGQILSLAKLNLNTMEHSDKVVVDTKNLVGKAINDLRNLTRSLHGDVISGLGLSQSISNELSIIEGTRQFKTTLRVNGNAYKMDNQKEMVLFRIVQEALNNCIKYSKASNIEIDLDYLESGFSMKIKDNGVGFSNNVSKEGIGLKSMQNRTNMIGGKFQLDSVENAGTAIIIYLPNAKPQTSNS